MTFSIAGRCARTGMLGVAITTSSICVAARCPWARAGVGAVVTQNVTDPALGPAVLDLLADGMSAAEALARITRDRPHIEHRQLAVVDSHGATAHFTGTETLGTHGAAEGPACVAVGNLLAAAAVPQAMAAAFTKNPGRPLADRLLAALAAGQDAGGEVGPVRSAGLLVVDEAVWPVIDLRIDWNEDDPIAALSALWRAYEPQMVDYVTRARDPEAAPSYGVPGDP